MSEQGIVGLLTPKTQEGVEKLKISTGYDLSKVNLNERELKRIQAYQGFVRVVKDVLTTVVLNEGLDEPTREKYNAALKQADEFLTHLEVRSLGVTFFRSLYRSAARLVEEQRTLAGVSNERVGLLENQLTELTGKYEAIEAQYKDDKESWTAREQGYQQRLAEKDKAYSALQEGKDVLQELANTLARANNNLRNESARKDNIIYELGQARERDAAKLAKAEIDLEARVGQEKENTRAAEDKISNVVEALKQTLKDKYGLTDEELLNIPKDKDPAEFYLELLNTKILEDKSNIKATQASLEDERKQRADNYKSAVEEQPVEPEQDDLSQVLVEQVADVDQAISPAEVVERIRAAGGDPLLGLSLAAESVKAPAESHDDAEEVRKIAERTLARLQEVAELPKRTLDEVTAGMSEEVAPPVEEAPEEEHVVNVILGEPVVPSTKAPNAPEHAPEAGSPAPAAPELDLSAAFAESLPEGIAQPLAVPKEQDLFEEFGDAVPVEKPK